MVFEKEVSNKIKGIAALCVMLSHYFNRNEIVPPLCMISDGALWVGIFFLFSGFGLERSYQRKDNYLEGFFRKKIVKIYLPFLLAETVYTLAALYKGEKLSLIEVILGCSGILGMLLSSIENSCPSRYAHIPEVESSRVAMNICLRIPCSIANSVLAASWTLATSVSTNLLVLWKLWLNL